MFIVVRFLTFQDCRNVEHKHSIYIAQLGKSIIQIINEIKRVLSRLKEINKTIYSFYAVDRNI